AVALLLGVALGQPAGTLDRVVIRDTKKDGATKTYDGALVLDKAGLRVMGGEKADKLVATIEPADLLKFTPGELAGVGRSSIRAQVTGEDKKTKRDYEAARLGYTDLLNKATGAPDRTKRYLGFKVAQMTSKVADETADDEGWAAQADAAIKAWDAFLA